jgi:hypothetical protein
VVGTTAGSRVTLRSHGIRRFFLAVLTAILVVPAHVLAQTEKPPSEPVKEGSLLVAILVLEAVAFGTATAARSEDGARVVGVIDGVSGLAVLTIAVSTDSASGWPEFTVPYGIGLLGLSFYNFAHASSSRRDGRFWVNAIGVNVTVLASVLTATVRRENRSTSRAVRMGVGPGSVYARITF